VDEKGETIMSRLTAWAAAALFVSAGLAPTLVSAQERYDDVTMKELGRFNIDIGAFVISDYNTTLRLDSTTVPIGTVIDLEDNLDVESSTSSGRIDGFYRFNKKHRIDFTYYRGKRDGSAVAQDDIVIGDPDDPDGECIIGADSSVQSQWEFELLKVGYSWSFLNTRRYELFLGGGLNVRDLDINIDAQGNLTGCDLDSGGSTNISSGGAIPLPTFNFGGRWNFTPKWQTRWQFQVFALEFGDYKGSTSDTQLLFEHKTFKNVGFGGGLNSFDLQLEADADDLKGEIASDYLGLYAYVKVYY
jgi:hypothetical protein